jgi:hypothetical protein
MGSNINIEMVQRHLDSVGHSLSSQGVASLLRNLGFSVNAVEQEKVKCTSPEERLSEVNSRKKTIDEPLLPGRTCKAVSADIIATAPVLARNRAPASGVNMSSSLAAKLDALETQLHAINALQTNLRLKLETDHQKLPRPAASASVSISLGSEAQQLRDWAAGTWPHIQEMRSKKAWLSVDSEVASVQSSNSPQISKRQGGRNTIVKKRDPVARYQ